MSAKSALRHIRPPSKYDHCWPWRSSIAKHIRDREARGGVLQLNFENMGPGAGVRAQTSVLLIEDETIIAEDLRCIVEQLGLRVSGVARTCAEAIALAKRAPPDLILSDIRLADGSSGAEATEAILEDRDVPVIFLTACPHEVPPLLREAAFVITKPYREATVRMTIERAVSRQCDCPKLRECICPTTQPPF
jgi:CheY-like chemotaxis protein